MKVIADLHVHSKYSRATSKNLDLENLEKYGRIKGLNLIGTGDFTHPEWIKELKKKLSEDGTGILKSSTGFNFIFQTEISNIYTQDGKQRRIHNIILAPDFATVGQIIEALGKKGRLDYDGRPIFGFSCVELAEILMNINRDIEIIPAHCWTPWYSLFGSMSGFDSVEECFQEQSKNIHALETGLSSDPAMNWRLSQLDKYALVSFSDSHSFWPWRIGREATVFELKQFTYKNLINAIRTKDGLIETIEVDPNFGKYHLTGHRSCEVCLEPNDAIKNNNICPKCRRQLTIGVLQRVEQLADREIGYIPRVHIPFKSLLPLAEIISTVTGHDVSSKSVFEEYFKLVKNRNEFDVLVEMPYEELIKIASEKIAVVILKNREGNLRVLPGYDGVYGRLVINDVEKEKIKQNMKPIQHSLEKFL